MFSISCSKYKRKFPLSIPSCWQKIISLTNFKINSVLFDLVSITRKIAFLALSFYRSHVKLQHAAWHFSLAHKLFTKPLLQVTAPPSTSPSEESRSKFPMELWTYGLDSMR